jgi:gliding motility-associated-like protein
MNRLLTTICTFLVAASSLWSQIPCNGEFVVSGSASNQGNCIQLTPNAPGQSGCTWLNTPVDFSMPLTHTMTLYFGTNDASGADGICLVYKQSSSPACGQQGGGIGAAGIANSFIVEFDTWNNGAAVGDIPQDHCAINLNGNMNSPFQGPVALPNIEDGQNHTVTMEWDPGPMTYAIYFDGVLRLSGVYDIINNVFAGNPLAYWGYTASTGASTNVQRVCPILPEPINVDAGPTAQLPCVGASTVLDGTGSDQASTYTYEWSTLNGQIISGENTLTPTVSGPGTYILTLYDEATGCTEEDQVVITASEINATIAPPGFLGCSGPLTLDGSASSSGPNITYEWSTPDGNIVSENGPVATVNQEGTYTLTVIYNDGLSECVETFTANVVANPDIPIAFVPEETILCDPPTVTLDGSGSSSGPDYSYEWSTPDGLILSGANSLYPVVGEAGSYTLTVINNETGCSAEYEMTVLDDTQEPTAIVADPGMLTCLTTTLVLNGSQSIAAGSQGLSFDWQTSQGVIVDGQGSPQLTIGAVGQYTLIVTDVENGCEDTFTLTVEGDDNLPTVAITPADPITCLQSQLTLDATASDQDPGLVYTWTTDDGTILDGAQTLTPIVTAAGVYQLTIINPANGCLGSGSVSVVVDTLLPVAAAGESQVFVCGAESLNLDGSNSSAGGGYSYQWSTNDGLILSGANTLTPSIGLAGIYQLQVTNTNNGCSATDFVVIGNDTDVATVLIAAADTLNCSRTEIVLNAGGSSTGSIYQYLWTTADGNIVSGASSLMPTINQAGTYTLNITNLSNNCTASASVAVQQDITAPVVAILPPDTLNCLRTALLLDASASSAGNEFIYNWTTTDGRILQGGQSQQPTINQAGSYLLQITNTRNECSSTGSVAVAIDTLAPLVHILPPPILSCVRTSLTLDATTSSQGSEYTYVWSPSLSGDVLNPQVSSPGNYQLLITDSDNGCSSSGSIVVSQDITPPVANAGPDQLLNCFTPIRPLQGQSSSSGPGIRYQWSSTDGQVSAAEQIIATPSVITAGLYVLEVLNEQNGCRSRDSVMVTENFSTPQAIVATPPVFGCLDDSIVLDGTASTTAPEIQYSWSTSNGAIIGGGSSPEAIISQAGTYVLLVSNQSSGCAATDTVQVLGDASFPIITIETPLILNCTRQSQPLEAAISLQSGTLSYGWTTEGGNFLSGQSTLSPVINAPGIYRLSAVNQDNGCDASVAVTVLQDIIAPTIAVSAPDTLDCTTPSLNLSATGSSSGSGFQYNWSTTNGNIVSGGQSPSPLVNRAGQYSLTIINVGNGCQATATATVMQDTIRPIALILPPAQLNCTRLQTALNGTGSSTGVDIRYTWATTGGQLAGPTNSISAQAVQPGTYILTVINQRNGCRATASAGVTQDIVLPTVNLAPPATLTCIVTQLSLNAAGSSQGSPFDISWTTQGGQFVGGTTGLQPLVNAPGSYTLTIRNTSNTCQQSATVNVIQDIVRPNADAGEDFVISCFSPTASLDGSASTTGTGIVYAWTSPDGSLEGGTTTLTPSISSPGIYRLLVTNQLNGCTDNDEVLVTQLNPRATTSSVQPGCYGQKGSISFTQTTEGVPPYLYSVDGGNTFQTGSSFSELSAGVYSLVVQDINGCEYRESLEIVQPDSLIVVITEPFVRIGLGESHQVIAQTNVADSQLGSVIWDNGSSLSCTDCLTPVASPLETSVYQLTVRDMNGCKADAMLRIIVDRRRYIYVPSAFSPNGDGINDLLLIYVRPETVRQVKRFDVYNRWGESVYSAANFAPNDPVHGWDGLFRGQPLQPAVFAYYAEVEFIDGTVEIVRGDVTLVK